MRWIHIASVVTLIGGFHLRALRAGPGAGVASAAERELVGSNAVASFRPLLFTVLVTALGSGVYNYATKGTLSAGLSHVDGHQAAAGAAHLRRRRFLCGARVERGQAQPHSAEHRDHPG